MVRGAAEVRDHVCGVGRRASVAERQQLPARVEALAQGGCRPDQNVTAFCERLRTEVRHFARLHQDRTPHVLLDAGNVRPGLLEERVEEAGGAGAGVRAAELVEEDVDELPEQVIRDLGELLGDERVVAGGSKIQLSPALIVSGPKEMTMSSGPRKSS